MLTPPLARNLEASVRDLESARAGVRVSSVADLVRHAQGSDEVRARAIPLLEKALASDTAPEVRAASAVALGDLGAHEALSALLVAVEDADLNVRQMALNALGEIGDVRALPRLRRALTDARPEVRYQGIIAYCRVATAEATRTTRAARETRDRIDDVLEAITRALCDDDAAVRYIALRLVEERVEHERESASWDRIAPRAEKLLRDPARQVALVAAIVLAKLGDASGHDLIAKVVRGQVRADKEDEREAVEMAGEIGRRELIPHLERRAWGAGRWLRDTCAFHAKIALARLDHPRAVAEIGRDLGSPKRDVRSAAVVAAGRALRIELRGAIEALAADAVDAELRSEALARLASAQRAAERAAERAEGETE